MFWEAYYSVVRELQESLSIAFNILAEILLQNGDR
jgi:hypothetical protein